MWSLHDRPEKEPGYLYPLQFYVANKLSFSNKPLPKHATQWSPGISYTDLQDASEPSYSTVYVTGGADGGSDNAHSLPNRYTLSENGNFSCGFSGP